MKLLFDQNLSPRLPLLLGNLYPGSVHVREVDLSAATDTVIWEYAKRNAFTIVSKDSKFIWLRLGNCPVAVIRELLQKHSAAIHTFEQDPTKFYLMLV